MSDANKPTLETNAQNDMHPSKFQFEGSISILKQQHKVLENHLHQLEDIKSRLASAIKNDSK